MTKRTFDDFDLFADNYRDIHTRNIKISGADSFYFAEMKVLHVKKYESGNAQILDVGCGDGVTELFMQQHFSGWKISGIDVSEKSIAAARKRELKNATFTVYDGIHIPFEDNHFDILFVAGVLHHVDFSLHDALVKEMYRVLKEDGRVYLFEHNPLNPLTKFLVRTCIFDKDARLLKSSYTQELFTKNKLQISRKDFIIFFPRKGIFSKLIFLEKYLQWFPLGGQYMIKAIKARQY